ncbi:MerR family transcriptional regulator [Vannielia litorea]|uniref:MerR HTH family regulatory protein n=1 Tax=Vannielia litorea TaxID=1217970 RepID=A0A1N6FB38_9RHOB|nr:MerR family transcriptional regulator [Vannielia litorea]SIN92406.1 MerR HTH family regulatory protein [Vannielia litorea]
MGKAPDAFRTISEVADWLGVQTHVLRFWESKFAQVKPLKRAGGRRYYRPADMELLGGIRKLLHEDGLTIKGAQKFIRENGVKAVAELSPPVDLGAADEPDAVETRDQAQPPETVVDMTGETQPPSVTPAPAGFYDAVNMSGEAPAPAVEPEPEGYFEAVDVSGEEPTPAVEPEPEGYFEAVDVSGEAPAPAVEAEPEGYFEAVDVSGEAPAPAVEPEPEGYFEAVDVSGEEPAPAAEVHILRDGPEDAVDMTGEAPAPAPGIVEAAPEQKSNFFVDPPEEDDPEVAPVEAGGAAAEKEEMALPSFIRKPMDGRETTVPPVTPGPLPLTGADQERAQDAGLPDARFAGVGASQMPDRAQDPQDQAERAPQAPAPAPAGQPDMTALRPLYDRLIALRARMG